MSASSLSPENHPIWNWRRFSRAELIALGVVILDGDDLEFADYPEGSVRKVGSVAWEGVVAVRLVWEADGKLWEQTCPHGFEDPSTADILEDGHSHETAMMWAYEVEMEVVVREEYKPVFGWVEA